uniref:hypothetical protein n=1 Tax=uncultured Sphingomonas sp. TaxID=158754 RepID=UPI0035CB05CB
MAAHVQIDAWDPVAAATVTLYAGSHDDVATCHFGGLTWWPMIGKLPTLRYDLFDGAFAGQITAPSSTMTLRTEAWPDFARYSFPDARFRLWTGDATGTTWTLRFDGKVTSQPQVVDGAAEIDFAVDDAWLDKPLLATYAGTSGAEGAIAMKGQVKPLALGAPLYVSGKLIDSVNSVFQISSYGVMSGIDAALEKLSRFSAAIGDYASYAALVAATIPAGKWATARAVGMARFGAPPTGQISFLVSGDAAGPDGWVRTPGKVIRRIAGILGASAKLDNASLDALDAAMPYPISLYLDAQSTARQLIQQIAASVNAVAGVSWLGLLFVASVGIGTPTITLAADGSSMPPVKSVTQINIDSPWQKLTLAAQRAWTVHALGDIAFTAPLVPLGLYLATTTYREGNIATLADGSSWLYVSTTPTAGNAPGAGSAFWRSQDPATVVDWNTGVAPGNGKPADGATRNDDGANMIPAPALLDKCVLTGGAYIETPGGATRPAEYRRAVLDSVGATVAWCGPGSIPCIPGETLWYADSVQAPGTGTDVINAAMNFYAADGSALSPAILSQAATTLTAANGIWLRRVASFVVPAGAATVQPTATRPTKANSVRFNVGESWLGGWQPSAGVTATAQVNITVPTATINATSGGAIIAGQLPYTVTPTIVKGAVDVRTAATSSYALANISSNLSPGGTPAVTVSNASDSTRGQVTIGTGITGGGTYTLIATVDGIARAGVVGNVLQVNAPPATTGAGTGGGSASVDLSGTSIPVASTVLQTFTGLIVASGKSLAATWPASYDMRGAVASGARSSQLSGQWQYSPAGAGTWTAFGS